jgi:hypothetical protein
MQTKIWLHHIYPDIYQAAALATTSWLIGFAIPIASQANPFQPQILNRTQIINQPLNQPSNQPSNQFIQSPAQVQPGYVLVTPKYARPAMAPDLTFLLPYNFVYNSTETEQRFNAAPNQPFIQQFNQFSYQIPGQLPNQFPNQFPSQAPNLNQQLGQPTNQAPQYAAPQLLAPLPLGQGKIIRQN